MNAVFTGELGDPAVPKGPTVKTTTYFMPDLKLIAVGSAKRLPNRPDTPTIAETLPAIPRALGWFAVMGPPGTPEPIAKKISDDLRKVLSEPALVKRFEDIASYVNPMSGAELLSYIRTEQALWKPVIEQISTFKAAPK